MAEITIRRHFCIRVFKKIGLFERYGSAGGHGAYTVPASALEERLYLVKKTLCGF